MVDNFCKVKCDHCNSTNMHSPQSLNYCGFGDTTYTLWTCGDCGKVSKIGDW